MCGPNSRLYRAVRYRIDADLTLYRALQCWLCTRSWFEPAQAVLVLCQIRLRAKLCCSAVHFSASLQAPLRVLPRSPNWDAEAVWSVFEWLITIHHVTGVDKVD
jgi:hypothetical protein